jgi:hypothetical protein
MSARLWTAHLAPGRAADRTDLIDDRWRWGAFLFPLLWALWNRHWLLAVALAAVAAGLSALAWAGLAPVAAVIEFGVRLWLGLEGGETARLDRALRGWREMGGVEAETEDEAALRWFGVRSA